MLNIASCCDWHCQQTSNCINLGSPCLLYYFQAWGEFLCQSLASFLNLYYDVCSSTMLLLFPNIHAKCCYSMWSTSSTDIILHWLELSIFIVSFSSLGWVFLSTSGHILHWHYTVCSNIMLLLFPNTHTKYCILLWLTLPTYKKCIDLGTPYLLCHFRTGGECIRQPPVKFWTVIPLCVLTLWSCFSMLYRLTK